MQIAVQLIAASANLQQLAGITTAALSKHDNGIAN